MYKVLLGIHIVTGGVALLSGATAIVARKGGKLHNRAGNIYYLSMYSVAFTALLMTMMKFNPFLLSIALFSFYMTWGGKRSIDNWRMKQAYIPTWKHRLPDYLGLLTGLFMIAYPAAIMLLSHETFVPVLGVFGALLVFLSTRNIRYYAKPAHFVPRNKMWLIFHISQMSGAYIATFTAFLLNNFTFDPGWVLWLGPTFVGAPLIFLAINKWIKKLKLDKQPA